MVALDLCGLVPRQLSCHWDWLSIWLVILCLPVGCSSTKDGGSVFFSELLLFSSFGVNCAVRAIHNHSEQLH